MTPVKVQYGLVCVCERCGDVSAFRTAVNSVISLYMSDGWDWDYRLRWAY